MRDINEILNNKKIKKIYRNVTNDKSIQVKLDVQPEYDKEICIVKFTKAFGWEHLAVSHPSKIPSWNTMQEMKEMFWKDEEECFQLHPKKSEYINNNEFCLHIWRSLDKELLTPPSILVGLREDHIEEDREWLKRMQKELGYPLTDKQIDALIIYNKLYKEVQNGIKNKG